MGGFEILMDEAALVKLAQRRGDADGEAQYLVNLQGRADQPRERLAARILEQEHGPTACAHELQRPHRPRQVQLVLQAIFVGEAIENGGLRVLAGGPHAQHGGLIAIGRFAPYAVQGKFAVLQQKLDPVIRKRSEAKNRVQLVTPH
jgi:hypothetical protein